MAEEVIRGPTQLEPTQRIDPLAEIIGRWRWKPVEPLDEETARRVGGRFLTIYLIDKPILNLIQINPMKKHTLNF